MNRRKAWITLILTCAIAWGSLATTLAIGWAPKLGLDYKYAHLASPLEAEISKHRHIFESAGLRCYVGSDTPF